jgi:hypothetical protein
MDLRPFVNLAAAGDHSSLVVHVQVGNLLSIASRSHKTEDSCAIRQRCRREGGELRPASYPFARGATQGAAPVFVLLASEEASYISRAVMPVTGGQAML